MEIVENFGKEQLYSSFNNNRNVVFVEFVTKLIKTSYK